MSTQMNTEHPSETPSSGDVIVMRFIRRQLVEEPAVRIIGDNVPYPASAEWEPIDSVVGRLNAHRREHNLRIINIESILMNKPGGTPYCTACIDVMYGTPYCAGYKVYFCNS